MRDTVCIYSGGMDSLTLAGLTFVEGRLHTCLSFDYGQKHKKELAYAAGNCQSWRVEHLIIPLTALQPCLVGSALTDAIDMPQGHYAEENMKLTVVPNRNMIMLSIAIAYAVSNSLKRVLFGAHSGDHTIYPDCRPAFVAAMDLAGSLANWHPVQVEAPFLHMDKAGILVMGTAIGLDYGLSWTCYEGRSKACGKCGSCQERLEGFAKIGKVDPLEYES